MFLNPLMLMGIGAAAVPLVLHLLSRSRYRNVDWGAMMFLQGADARNRQSTRLNQFFLMLVRMAVVALLAAALARPVVSNRWAGGADEGGTTAVIVLDCSASMDFDENGHTRFELARGAALQVLAALRPGDRAALVLTGQDAGGVQDADEWARRAADLRPRSDLRTVAERVNSLQPGYGRADLAAALATAADVLDRPEAAASAGRDIYLITDRQDSNWSTLGDDFPDQWRQRVGRVGHPVAKSDHDPPPPPRLFVVPVGGPESDNLVVESVQLLNAPAIRGQTAEIEVRLHNHGPVQRAAVPLRLSVGGRPLPEIKVNLAANAGTSVRVPVPFTQSGSHVLSASVKSAGLTADDSLDTVIDVIDPVRVLVISGDERTPTTPATPPAPGAPAAAPPPPLSPFGSESTFLRLALAPHRAAGKPGAADPAEVTVVPAEMWSGNTVSLPSERAAAPGQPAQAAGGADLRRFQVIVLANVERFTADQSAALERFVYDGGGLLVAPGNLSRVDEYNAALFRDGAGILPAELMPATAGDGSQATTVLGFQFAHPVFRFLRGRPDPIPSATIGRYFPANPRMPDARPLAEYVSGQPFLIEGAAGSGRVLLVTTPLDADWNTLPLSSFYLPFTQSAVRYLAGGAVRDRNLQPGDPIQVKLGDAATTAPPADAAQGLAATLHPPAPAGPVSLEPLKFGKATELRYADTDRPGLYRLELKGPAAGPDGERQLHFVVRRPPGESDPAQLTPERWGWVQDALGFRRLEGDAGARGGGGRPIAAAVVEGRGSRELWTVLLGAVLVLAVLEMAVARRWSRDG